MLVFYIILLLLSYVYIFVAAVGFPLPCRTCPAWESTYIRTYVFPSSFLVPPTPTSLVCGVVGFGCEPHNVPGRSVPDTFVGWFLISLLFLG